MGAFLVTYPGDRIKVLWFFGFFARVTQVPAFVLIGLWLASQVLNQMGAVVEADAGGVGHVLKRWLRWTRFLTDARIG